LPCRLLHLFFFILGLLDSILVYARRKLVLGLFCLVLRVFGIFLGLLILVESFLTVVGLLEIFFQCLLIFIQFLLSLVVIAFVLWRCPRRVGFLFRLVTCFL